MKRQIFSYVFFLLLCFQLLGQRDEASADLWKLTERESTVLHCNELSKFPHKDNMEMAGKKIASIISYEIDEDGNLDIDKDIIFPQLRTYNKTNESEGRKYRAYFRRSAGGALAPQLSSDNKLIVPSRVDSIEIDGMLTFYYAPVNGLKITKQIYPSMDDRLLVETWQIENKSSDAKDLTISEMTHIQSEQGCKGVYKFVISGPSPQEIKLEPSEVFSFPVYYGALLNDEKADDFSSIRAKESREKFLNVCRQNLVLTTPDEVLNQLFYFSKIRAAESIYNSSMGLVHSPGGGNYYVGIWANDQIENSGPFFPYLGYEIGKTAAFNAYKKFLDNIPEQGHIPYAFEVDGNFPMTHLDRGDAAMIAYGTSMYLLNSGSLEQAETLWPLIEWSLAYCHKNRNTHGAVVSQSDEMEGRIETGDANLSTSTLYYGGLKFGALIAKNLGNYSAAELYEMRRTKMEEVIEEYFGQILEGLETYRYFDENKYLRHWICLPLTMGNRAA